jgi:sugar phosphate isomerase/epimerase
MPKSISRRAFLGQTGTFAALAAAPTTTWGESRTSTSSPLRLGGPIFIKSDDPADIAQEHRRLGYRAAYGPVVDLKDTDKIKAIMKEFAARDVIIAEVGGWCNMLDPDAEKRRKNMEKVKNRLALADLMGARTCPNIAGSYNAHFWCGPDPRNITEEFIEATVENCRAVIDEVKPTRTTFSIEMMPFNFPSGPDDYLKLIQRVDRKAFAVHLDACNVMNSPERMYNNGTIIDECFRKLGPWIVSCHAKDLSWEDYVQVCLREVIPGRGSIDYHAYLRGLAGLPSDVPLMLEHLKTAEEFDEGRLHIQSVAHEMGLSFGTEAS